MDRTNIGMMSAAFQTALTGDLFLPIIAMRFLIELWLKLLVIE